MRRAKNKIIITFIQLLLFLLPTYSQVSGAQDSNEIIWIYFKDKGPNAAHKLHKATNLISERAIQRRLKVKHQDQLINKRDLPVAISYIESIEPFIKKVRAKSKWLNAISVEVDPAQIQRIESLDFVERTSRVLTYIKNIPKDEMEEADRHLKDWFKAFPEVFLCRGNHDNMADRKK